MFKMPALRQGPKGFEGYFGGQKQGEQGEGTPGFKVTCITADCLLPDDLAQIEEVRRAALTEYISATGNELEVPTFAEELLQVPAGMELSDRLVLRAFDGEDLAGYIQVLTEWPEHDEWSIEQLVLDPAYHLHGVGSTLVSSVENLARTAEARAASIFSIPSRPTSPSFWCHMGYADKTGEFEGHLGGSTYCSILRKEL